MLHLAAAARARGLEVAVVCRRYRPGPAGHGDEELLYAAALGAARVFAGTHKRELAQAAARAGAKLDPRRRRFLALAAGARPGRRAARRAPTCGAAARLLPAGRLREPAVALQRAGVIVVSRLAPGEDPAPLLAEVRRRAPAAWLAAARHAVDGVLDLAGAPCAGRGAARVLTATGNPEAVARECARGRVRPGGAGGVP